MKNKITRVLFFFAIGVFFVFSTKFSVAGLVFGKILNPDVSGSFLVTVDSAEHRVAIDNFQRYKVFLPPGEYTAKTNDGKQKTLLRSFPQPNEQDLNFQPDE